MHSYDELKEERQQVIDYVVNRLLTTTEGRVRMAMAAGDKTTVIKFTRDVAEDILEAYTEKLTELGYAFTTKKHSSVRRNSFLPLQEGRMYDYNLQWSQLYRCKVWGA